MEENKLYDLTTIYAISDNNPQFLEKLLLVFVENVSKDLESLNLNAKAGNWDEVGQVAHKMKPSLSHFQINAIKAIILELEYPSNTDISHRNSLVMKVNDVMVSVITGLKAEFPNVFI